MKLHFDELFSHRDDQVIPKFDVTSVGICYKKGDAFPANTTLFGVVYSTLLSHTFEVTELPESGYEIKAYYVR
jgi:hypothetical protein